MTRRIPQFRPGTDLCFLCVRLTMRTAWFASGIALWVFAQVPGCSGAVLPKRERWYHGRHGARVSSRRDAFRRTPQSGYVVYGEKGQVPLCF